MLHTRKLLIAAVAGLTIAATACSGGGAPKTNASSGSQGGNAGGTRYTIAMVTHEQPGTTFWDRVRAGAEQAAKNDNVQLKYSNDPQQANQATLVQNAIDSKADGIAVTLAAPDAVGPMLQKAAQAGIPTVALNAGLDTYQKYGALMYFGSDENLAGEAAGARLSKEGGKKALCIVHAEGVSSLEARCAGVKKGFPNTENLQVNGADLAAATSTLQAKLAQDKSITDIVTLDAGVAGAATQAKQAAGSQAKIVTFDLNQDVVNAIQDKTIEFCIDQQPYLQGYLAVDGLWLNLTNGNDIGGGKAVLTGPSFVDSSNIDKIAGFAANNTR
jgi:simple sugar transport system substrate-binding protein